MSLLLTLVLFTARAAAQLYPEGNFLLQGKQWYSPYGISSKKFFYKEEPVYPGFYSEIDDRSLGSFIEYQIPQEYSSNKLILQPANQYITNNERFDLQKRLKYDRPPNLFSLRRTYYPLHLTAPQSDTNAEQEQGVLYRSLDSPKPVMLYPDLPDPLTNIMKQYSQKNGLQNRPINGHTNVQPPYMQSPNRPPIYMHQPHMTPLYINPANRPPENLQQSNMQPPYYWPPNRQQQYNPPPIYNRPSNNWQPPTYMNPVHSNMQPVYIRPPPKMQYPNRPPPNMQYPNRPPPNMQYPNRLPPNMQYPNRPPPNMQYPNRPPPNMQYPNRPPPNMQYPNRPPPNMQYPNRPPPNMQLPNRPPNNMEYPNRPPPNIQYPNRPPPNMQLPNRPPPNMQYPNRPPPNIQYPNNPQPIIQFSNRPPPNIHSSNRSPSNMQHPNRPLQNYGVPPHVVPINVIIPNVPPLNPYVPIILYPNFPGYELKFPQSNLHKTQLQTSSPYMTTSPGFVPSTNSKTTDLSLTTIPLPSSPQATVPSMTTSQLPISTGLTTFPYSSTMDMDLGKISTYSDPLYYSISSSSQMPSQVTLSQSSSTFPVSQYPSSIMPPSSQPPPVVAVPGRSTFFPSPSPSWFTPTAPWSNTGSTDMHSNYQTSYTPSRVTDPVNDLHTRTTVGQRISDLPEDETSVTQSEGEAPSLRTSFATITDSEEDLLTPTPTKSLDNISSTMSTNTTKISTKTTDAMNMDTIKSTEATMSSSQVNDITTETNKENLTSASELEETSGLSTTQRPESATSANTITSFKTEDTTEPSSTQNSMSDNPTTDKNASGSSTATFKTEEATESSSIMLSSGTTTNDKTANMPTVPVLENTVKQRLFDTEINENSSESPFQSSVTENADCNQDLPKQTMRRQNTKTKKKCKENVCKNAMEKDIEAWLHKNFGRLMQKIADIKAQNAMKDLQQNEPINIDSNIENQDIRQIKEANYNLANYGTRFDDTYLGESEFKRHAIYE